MTWMSQREQVKYNKEVQAKLNDKRKEKPSDEVDTDFIDVDKLLVRYCDEFHAAKKQLQRQLQKRVEIELRRISYE